MNKALEVYFGLMDLVKHSHNDFFFYKDFVQDDITYRVFDYRLVSWRGFQQPYAKHCRGITYDVTVESNPILVSLPPDKFFNYSEGGIDYTHYDLVFYMEKLDGSLVSSYLHNDELRLKTKSSLSSEQALAAMCWLSLPENVEYYDFVHRSTKRGRTINFEWTSPSNHIVIRYDADKLTMINERDMETFDTHYMTEHPHYVKHTIPSDNSIEKLVDATYADTYGEGIVMVLKSVEGNSHFVKVKNHLYVQLHGLKDSVNNTAKLAEMVLEGNTDDMRQKFIAQPEIIKMIDDAESHIIRIYNNLIKKTEVFYEDNKHLERKAYALKAHSELGKNMTLVMDLYTGRTPKYKEHSIKNLSSIYGV